MVARKAVSEKASKAVTPAVVPPVYIIGAGMLRFGKYQDRSIKDLAAEAVRTALKDAGLEKDRIEALWFANSGWGMNGGQDCIRGQVALRPSGVEDIPIVNVENACAGGATALNGAFLGIASGQYDVAMAVGAEKVFQPDRIKMFASFIGALDVENLESLIEQARSAGRETGLPPPPASVAAHPPRSLPDQLKGLAQKGRELPVLVRNLIVITDHYQIDLWKLVRQNVEARFRKGAGASSGGMDHSPFMDVYAMACRRHMKKYGSTQRQLAVIAAKNHSHSAVNPLAQIQKPMTVDQVMADKSIAWPLTRSMCAPIGDGAAAAIVCSGRFFRKLQDRQRAVRILASAIGSGRNRSEDEPDIGERLSRRAYAVAGIGPGDVNLAECHDATAFGELHQSEALGFCEEGKGGELAESGATRIGGRIPLNTSGGLESRGHPIAASGLAQIYEVVTQLRGEAGERQVEGARIGLTQNGGGALGVEEAAMGIHILERVAARR
ncbi:MAG: thiolase family protein [Deltaproteobacteria bacterium]|nr:thiolase family protein [Deltaproteobacteria bacterium]